MIHNIMLGKIDGKILEKITSQQVISLHEKFTDQKKKFWSLDTTNIDILFLQAYSEEPIRFAIYAIDTLLSNLKDFLISIESKN